MKLLRTLLNIIVLLSLTITLVISCNKGNVSNKTERAIRKFNDDTERVLQLPQEIERIAVSGRIAQGIVFAIAPDNLVAVAEDWSAYEKTLLDKKYTSLPTIGRIFGSTGLLNKEALLSLNPDIIIDIGESKENIQADFDTFEKETGVPIVHFTLNKENLSEVYGKLGVLLSKQNEAETIIDFINKVDEKRKEILSYNEKKNALFITGTRANRVLQKGSYFSSSMDLCTNNIAEFPTLDKNKYAVTLSKEELIKLNADVIIFSSVVDKDELLKNDAITAMKAFKDGNYYFFPHIPYENMGFAPGPGEIFGTIWLLHTLYSNGTEFDYESLINEFYKIFFHKNQNI